jgi:Icc protein
LTKSPVKLVQLTDTHLFTEPERALRGVPTLPALQATLLAARDALSACEAILATGDLVQDDPGGYAHFRREFAALGKPVLCIPGNHDDLRAMHAELSQPPFQLGGTYDAGAWRIILLDSTVPGETGGALSEATLQLLDQALASSLHPHALVCLHHHPIPMKSRWLDTVGLENPGDFFEVLGRHSQVRGVLFGHVHQEVDDVRDGVRILATPSTCSQFKPHSDDFATEETPPAWRTLDLHEDGSIETRVFRLDSRSR